MELMIKAVQRPQSRNAFRKLDLLVCGIRPEPFQQVTVPALLACLARPIG